MSDNATMLAAGLGAMAVILALVAIALAHTRSDLRKARTDTETLRQRRPDREYEAYRNQPDYIVSINDWGPDFEDTDLGRWRWVIWRHNQDGAPVNIGNDISGQRAWLSVWGAIVRDWDGQTFTPTLRVDWKKVTEHGAEADQSDERPA